MARDRWSAELFRDEAGGLAITCPRCRRRVSIEGDPCAEDGVGPGATPPPESEPAATRPNSRPAANRPSSGPTPDSEPTPADPAPPHQVAAEIRRITTAPSMVHALPRAQQAEVDLVVAVVRQQLPAHADRLAPAARALDHPHLLDLDPPGHHEGTALCAVLARVADWLDLARDGLSEFAGQLTVELALFAGLPSRVAEAAGATVEGLARHALELFENAATAVRVVGVGVCAAYADLDRCPCAAPLVRTAARAMLEYAADRSLEQVVGLVQQRLDGLAGRMPPGRDIDERMRELDIAWEPPRAVRLPYDDRGWTIDITRLAPGADDRTLRNGSVGRRSAADQSRSPWHEPPSPRVAAPAERAAESPPVVQPRPPADAPVPPIRPVPPEPRVPPGPPNDLPRRQADPYRRGLSGPDGR